MTEYFLSSQGTIRPKEYLLPVQLYEALFLSQTIIGLCSIPAVHGFVSALFFDKETTLLLLAKYTVVIYLLNTIAIGVVKGVMLKFVDWNGYLFYIYIVVLTTAGVLLPIAIKKIIFICNAYLSHMTN